MTDVILLAHGKLATAMKGSGEMIFGELPNFIPLNSWLVKDWIPLLINWKKQWQLLMPIPY